MAESFNTDDMFMFFKTVLPIVTNAVREVFKENDIDVAMLDEFISNINNVNNFQFNNYASNRGAQGMIMGEVNINKPSRSNE